MLLLGHFDTVWPVGTTALRPFSVDGDVATGPGVFDMKAGIVQGLFAMSALTGSGVELLLTSDEELGSPTSRGLVEEAARGVDAVLVLEPSADGALKLARKGTGGYRIDVHGHAAHAGLEPERGVNALVELAAHVLAAAALADAGAGTSVTPAVATAGTTANTVPARAAFTVDVRAWTEAELARVDRGIRALAPVASGASLSVSGGIDRPPLAWEDSQPLFERACAHRAGTGHRTTARRSRRGRVGRQPDRRARDPHARRARRRRRRRARGGRARPARPHAGAGGARGRARRGPVGDPGAGRRAE